MPHPALGLPPADARAGRPDVAEHLLGAARLPASALAAALRLDPSFDERHDELMLRRFLRDYDQHIRQLARAVATGEVAGLVAYGESLVPTYRRRHVRMNDVVTLLRGLQDAAVALVPTGDAAAVRAPLSAWIERMRRHRRLPGDHAGNGLVRFVWKGAGLGDDTVV